ncbi:MAG: pilus assembly PilX family protein [Burkholderiales bacterium]
MKVIRLIATKRPKAERGVVLFIALIVLVAMSLAAVALTRSVDTGAVVAGNLAFKQGALQETNLGVEAAVAALSGPLAGVGATNNDVAAQNYYATTQQSDTRGIPTALTNLAAPATPGAATGFANEIHDGTAGKTATGNTIRYVVDRMCTTAGAASAANCNMSYPFKAEPCVDISAGCTPPEQVPMYRVSVRVDGPRNTLTYTQVFLRPA